MPTFKHPCPHCTKYINRDVAVCPYCGTRDPFAPARCPNCRTEITDLSWVACPRCGQDLRPAPQPQPTNPLQPSPNQPPASAYLNPNVPPPTPTPQPGPPPATPSPLAPQAVAAAKCSGCGAPLAPGARFCTVCGTLAS